MMPEASSETSFPINRFKPKVRGNLLGKVNTTEPGWGGGQWNDYKCSDIFQVPKAHKSNFYSTGFTCLSVRGQLLKKCLLSGLGISGISFEVD